MEIEENPVIICNFIKSLYQRVTEIHNEVIEHENSVPKCEICSENVNGITSIKNQLVFIMKINVKIKEEDNATKDILEEGNLTREQCKVIKEEQDYIVENSDECCANFVAIDDFTDSTRDGNNSNYASFSNTKDHCKRSSNKENTYKRSLNKSIPEMVKNKIFYECALCNTKVSRKCHLALHMKSHMKNKQGSRKRRHKGQHSNKESEENKKCPFCGRMYKRKHDCNLVEPKIVNSFSCIYCPATFSTYPKIYFHHKAQHPQNPKPQSPFQCEVCGKFTIQLSALRHHMKTHTGYTPHECNVCQKKFRTRHQLTEHLRKHIPKTEKDDKYKCNVCLKRFTFRQSLKKHERLQHTDNRKFFICSLCGWKFICETSLQKHLITHNTEKVPSYKCECGRIFEKLKYLNQHRKIQHNILTDLMLNRKTAKRE
ncbi:zinc finger protein 59-like [Lutzomyia longipalpis]|uniref:zinc finger protein 59-like n=1 Tax=Lutzomyia longipalpis TaxID=7200 RepID=UPI0024843B74|nr:zinc finger protein 59-like [Lutzomyia longipalpis]